MSCIELEDIRIYANHGCLSEEEKIGSHYLVNLKVECDLSKAFKNRRPRGHHRLRRTE